MPGATRITGLNTFMDRVLDCLAVDPGEKELAELHAMIEIKSRRVESLLRVNNLQPHHLTDSTRAIRGWLGFMASKDQFAGMVTALRTARPLIATASVGSRWHQPIRLEFRPMRGLYKLKDNRSGARLWLPTPAVCFIADDLVAVTAMVFKGDSKAKRHILDLMQSEEYQSITAELEMLGGAVEETQGQHHDLADSFARMNREHFADALTRPKLYWSRSLTRRKFGHYDWIGDAVMISRTLDAVDVPLFVVDFVMFHELLHKHHGIRWAGGRRFAHTPEFRRDERRFPQFTAAEEVIGRLARARQ